MIKKFKLNYMEFSGSLGDLGLFIPLVVAVCISCQLDIGVVLILAGLMNVLTGIVFAQPIPVQPMKALAAAVIAEGLLKEELIAAGIIMGLFLVFSYYTIDKINKYIPVVVVRGIQLGIGLKLIVKGFSWIKDLPLTGINSIAISVVVLIVLAVGYLKRWPLLLFVFVSGIIMLYVVDPGILDAYVFSLPKFRLYWPQPGAWINGFFKGAIVQLPLTLLNSVIAVCALSEEYFPGKGIAPKKMAFSVGLMNLVCVPLGGIPMCHGSGGLAAQYGFGARGATSVIFLGIMKILAGVVFGGALLIILKAYPMAVLGPMLIFAGIQLLKLVKHLRGSAKKIFIALIMAGCILIFNTLISFVIGCMLAIVLKEFKLKEANNA